MASTSPPGTRVAIIGGGLAGITSCAALIRAGFPPSSLIVFETSPSIGGIWASGGAYEGLATNTPGRMHSFFGQLPPEREELDRAYRMKAPNFLKRLETYAEQHGVLPCLKLECKVASIWEERGDKGVRFRLAWDDLKTKKYEQGYFDRLIFANGQYGPGYVPTMAAGSRWTPSRPDSKIFHSFDLSVPSNLDALKSLHSSAEPSEPGHIAVIGAYQSAIEVATILAKSGRQVTWLLRKPAWFIPGAGEAGVPDTDEAGLGSLTRRGSLGLPFYRETVNQSWIWYFVAQYFFHATSLGRRLIAQGIAAFQTGMNFFWGWDPSMPAFKGLPSEKDNLLQPLKPDTDMFWSFGHICVSPVGTKDLISEGKITMGRATITGLSGPHLGDYRKSGITLHLAPDEGGKTPAKITADAVVFATGAEPHAHKWMRPDLHAKLGFALSCNADPALVAKREAPYQPFDADELHRLLTSNPSIAYPPEGVRAVTNVAVEAEGRAKGWATQKRVAAPMRLFRGIVPIETAEERNVAVVGAGIVSFAGALTTQAQAEWVADYFKGAVAGGVKGANERKKWGTKGKNILTGLPSKEEMMRDTSARAVWARWLFDTTGGEGTWMGPHAIAYVDSLTRDMGLDGPIPFKWWKPWDYFTQVPLPALYSVLWDQKRKRDAYLGVSL